jgi:putative protease
MKSQHESKSLYSNVELLAPAGNAEKLQMAVLYGADAVYLSGNEFGMRAAAGNFAGDELKDAIAFCHAHGVKAYVTLNTIPRNDEISRLGEFISVITESGADAAIVTDIGVMGMVKRYAPALEIHTSTQAGIANHESARMWHDMGAKRVILARELSLDEIAGIRAKTPPGLDLECFVHGAMCVSFSGRCLLSEYMAGRDANRGACAQPCRWKYYLREEKREGEYYEIEEHKEGTYILNSKDLCAIRFLDKVAQAGVRSFKIEGRAKSEYYAAATTYAYRGAIDDMKNGLPFNEKWYEEVVKVSHREYSDGFFFGRPEKPMQHYSDSSYIRKWEVAAVVEQCDADGNAVVRHKNRFRTGDTLELMIPRGETITFTMGELVDDTDGTPTDDAKHPHRLYRCRLPAAVPAFSILRKEK